MKSEKGISYTKLLIIFAIIVAIGIGIGFYIKGIVEKENYESIKTNMLLIQAKAKVIKGDADMKADKTVYKGYQLSNLPEGFDIQEFLNKGLIAKDDYQYYYILNQQCLNDMGLSDIILKKDEYYVVDYDTSEIYYTKGFTDNYGMTFYKLSEFKEITL